MIEHGGSSFDYRSIREAACNAGAGATAGAIAATFVCPLGVIKTRLQVIGLPETPASGQRGIFATDHLMRFISKDPEGYVPIHVVASFKKIKAFVNSNSQLSKVLSNSSKLVSCILDFARYLSYLCIQMESLVLGQTW